jgi:hypothetical protein
MKTRKAAFAGRFYPDNELKLNKMLHQILSEEESQFKTSLAEKKIIGAVVPHAGYMFSAYQAIHFFNILSISQQQFDTFVIINPNHTGYGKPTSLDENDFWDSPFGKVEIDREFYDLLNIPVSGEAHKHEHSGEVMIPLLQYFIKHPFKIAPITILHQSHENAEILANKIFNANKILNKKLCIIASSDFSHFVHPEKGQQMDQLVIDEILNLNARGVEQQVKDNNISVCGYGPIMTLIEYSKLIMENPKAEVLKIGHSGEVIPSNEVVDYVSILIYKT